MSELERRLDEDRILRDAALGLFKADLALIRADLGERGIGARIKDRLGEGTADMIDEAVDYAEENRGKIAALAAAVVLWFGRRPIINTLERLFTDSDEREDAEPVADDSRSANN